MLSHSKFPSFLEKVEKTSQTLTNQNKLKYLSSEKNGFKFETKNIAVDAEGEGEKGRGQNQAEVELLPLLLVPLRRRPRHCRRTPYTHNDHLRTVDLLDRKVNKTIRVILI